MRNCVVLNAGMGSWAFQELAEDLAKNLDIEISDTPGNYNYVLAWDENDLEVIDKSFIPFVGMKLASDKRLLAKVFKENNIPTPETHLLDSYQDVVKFINNNWGMLILYKMCDSFSTKVE